MERPLLIILPGWGGTRQTWQTFIDALQTEFEVHCLELPCFGAEPCPTEIWGVEEYANFVKNKIDEIKGKSDVRNPKSVLLGHSFGGQVAVVLAATNSNICDDLILSGPAVFRHPQPLKTALFWLLAKLGKMVLSTPGLAKLQPFARRLLYKAADSPDYNKTTGIKREIFKKITRQDVAKLLPRIKVPTTVIAGRHDTYVSWRDSQKVAAAIPHARFELIAAGRHGLHHTHIATLKTILLSL